MTGLRVGLKVWCAQCKEEWCWYCPLRHSSAAQDCLRYTVFKPDIMRPSRQVVWDPGGEVVLWPHPFKFAPRVCAVERFQMHSRSWRTLFWHSLPVHLGVIEPDETCTEQRCLSQYCHNRQLKVVVCMFHLRPHVTEYPSLWCLQWPVMLKQFC